MSQKGENVDAGTVGVALISLVAGGALAFYITVFVLRPRLVISLEQVAAIAPESVGAPKVELTFGGRTVPNLCLLGLTIRNVGIRDIVVSDAAPTDPGQPRSPGATPLPRLDFKIDRFVVHGFRSLDNPDASFWIPLGRKVDGGIQRVYINIHRISRRTTAQIHIFGTFSHGEPQLGTDDARLFPGAITDVIVKVDGLIDRDLLTC